MNDRLTELLELLKGTEQDNGDPSKGVTPIIEQFEQDNDLDNLACNLFNFMYRDMEEAK